MSRGILYAFGASGQAGAVAGRIESPMDLYQLYSRSQVTVHVDYSYSGGIAGAILFQQTDTYKMSDIYAEALVKGQSQLGGLFGLIDLVSHSNVLLSNSYASNKFNLSGTINIGALIGDFTPASSSSLSFTNVFYDNSSSLSAFGSNNPPQSAPSTGLSFQDLVDVTNKTFDQCSIWSVERLRVEANFVPSPPVCRNAVETILSTNSPQTSNLSQTLAPTSLPISKSPQTTTPTTFPPTNLQTQTAQILTAIPTTSVPTMNPLLDCFYPVINCQHCPKNPIKFDTNQVDVACVYNGFVWDWIFENKTGDSIYNTGNLNLENQVLYIHGSFVQTSSASLTFTVDPNSETVSRLHLTQCFTLDGKVEVKISYPPPEGDSSYQIVTSYCSSQPNLKNDIQITPSYNVQPCEWIRSNYKVSTKGITVSIGYDPQGNCNSGQVIGGIFGGFFGLAIILALVIAVVLCCYRFRRMRRMEDQFAHLLQEVNRN